MNDSSRLLNLEFHHGMMGIKYNELTSRLKRVERLMNIDAMKKEEEMVRNKEISGTTEEIRYS